MRAWVRARNKGSFGSGYFAERKKPFLWWSGRLVPWKSLHVESSAWRAVFLLGGPERDRRMVVPVIRAIVLVNVLYFIDLVVVGRAGVRIHFLCAAEECAHLDF